MYHFCIFFGEVVKTCVHFLLKLFAIFTLGLELSSYVLDANLLREMQLENTAHSTLLHSEGELY